MVNLVPAIVVFLLLVCLSTPSSTFPNTQAAERKLNNTPSKGVIIARRLTNLWNWAKKLAGSENTFVGRCFGIAKKLRFVIPLMIFLLGVIVTTLKFLTIFSLKGLGLLILLLILNIGPIFAKLALLKSEPPPHYAAAPVALPQTVHFHLHNDKTGHYKIAHSGPGFEPEWSDRISEGLSKTTSLAEKIELMDLYKRLGFNVQQENALYQSN